MKSMIDISIFNEILDCFLLFTVLITIYSFNKFFIQHSYCVCMNIFIGCTVVIVICLDYTTWYLGTYLGVRVQECKILIFINRKIKCQRFWCWFTFQHLFYLVLYITLSIIYRVDWRIMMGFGVLYLKLQHIIGFQFVIAFFITFAYYVVLMIESLWTYKHLILLDICWHIFLTFIGIFNLLSLIMKYTCISFQLPTKIFSIFLLATFNFLLISNQFILNLRLKCLSFLEHFLYRILYPTHSWPSWFKALPLCF